MNSRGRPLSPHLSIYRWPITMTLSILHRVTGVALSAGFVLLTAWLLSAADGAEAHTRFVDLMQSAGGRVVLVGLSVAFFFHLANGIRHLIWDLGYGFEIPQANASSWLVVVSTLVLTLLYWFIL
ncbi:MAG TPA: succinate dehydrogenase, cytochrome b556 subunit [Woeseiaceae bacterium]|jgi:succinate dehydrogenase / fumarate reductase cytochrome b subunit